MKVKNSEVRSKILDISQNVTALHIGGSFSCVEILTTIYNNYYKKDNIILSKGHAGICQYVILNLLKKISTKDLKNYCTNEGKLGVHPHNKNPGIIASTGSLGHGLAIVAGCAYNRKDNFFAVLSDGELMEGSTWEAVLQISSLKINNLIAIIDYNGLQSSTYNKDTHPTLDPIDKKFKYFGWNIKTVNGHSCEEIKNAIKNKKEISLYV